MDTLFRKLNKKWSHSRGKWNENGGKKTLSLLRTVLVDGHPLRLKMGPQLLTAQCLFTSINRLQLHLFVCVRLIHCHARCVCVASHSLKPILVWICNFLQRFMEPRTIKWGVTTMWIYIMSNWIPACCKSVTLSDYLLYRRVYYTLRGLPVSFKTA